MVNPAPLAIVQAIWATTPEVLIVAAMLTLMLFTIFFFHKWNVKFEREKYDHRRRHVAEMLYMTAMPSWELPFEAAEPLLQERYLNNAAAILAYTDRTVTRV